MSIKSILKTQIQKESIFIKLVLPMYNNFPFNNSIKLRGGVLEVGLSQLYRNKVSLNGNGNEIIIGKGCRIKKCRIGINGSNNRIVIDSFSSLNGVNICIEDDNNQVLIGKHSTFEGNIDLACIEGTKLLIGEDCMFSANISIRTGDSHSVVDMNDKRINPSKDVRIGNHVWVGNTVLMTKGVVVSDDSVVGTGSVVTKAFNERNLVIAGNPARAVKKNILWERVRLPIVEEKI